MTSLTRFVRLFTIFFLFCYAASAARPNRNESSVALSERGWNRQLGQKCGRIHTCNSNSYCSKHRCKALKQKGASCKSNASCYSKQCFQNNCLGPTDRPVNAPCQVDDECNANTFCRHPKVNHSPFCKIKGVEGSSCSRNNVCQSGQCDLVKKKCASSATISSSTSVASTTSSSTTSPTASTTTPTPSSLQNAANSVIRNLQSVADSSIYTAANSPLESVPGRISTTGDVIVQAIQGKQNIVLTAEADKPAAIEDTLNTPLNRRGQLGKRDTSYIYQFQYAVSFFNATNPSDAICQIVPYVNGNALNPLIDINSDTSSGTANYFIQGTVSSFATTLICQKGAKAQVQYPSMTIISTSLPPPTQSTTITTTTTTSTSLPTPIESSPASSCPPNFNCGFEDGTKNPWSTDTNGEGKCYIQSSVVHSGKNAMQCDYIGAGRTGEGELFAYAYLPGHTIGKTYTLSFYARFANGASQSGLTCEATNDDSDETRASTGKSCTPIGEIDRNGWQQFQFTYTPTLTSGIILYVSEENSVFGTYYIDDFSLSPELNAEPSSTLTSSSASITSTSPISSSSTSSPQTTPTIYSSGCLPQDNCDFESGSESPWLNDGYGDGGCGLETTEVHSGKYAIGCTYTGGGQDGKGGKYFFTGFYGHTIGQTYTMSFYVKMTNGATSAGLYIDAQNDDDESIAALTQCTASGQIDSNGWQLYSFKYLANSRQVNYYISEANQVYGDYYFDDFSISPPLNGASSSSSITTSTTSTSST